MVRKKCLNFRLRHLSRKEGPTNFDLEIPGQQNLYGILLGLTDTKNLTMVPKGERRDAIVASITSLLDFLQPYLPLLNAHNSDFFTLGHWNKLIDPLIGEDLLSLTDEQLILLPSGKLDNINVIDEHLDPEVSPHRSRDETKMIYQPKERDNNTDHISDKPVWDPNILPTWKHHSLAHFMLISSKNTLPNTGVLTELVALRHIIHVDVDSDSVAITNFMSDKKSHEVNIMSKLCSDLAGCFRVDKVVDVGSGKGYLGCHLSLMHNLRVLGIDSADGKTLGAQKRKLRLQKHWQGLLRNALAEQDGLNYRKTRSGKNRAINADKIVVDLDSDSSETDPGVDQDRRQLIKTSGRVPCNFMPCTQFITKKTNLTELICLNFPQHPETTAAEYMSGTLPSTNAAKCEPDKSSCHDSNCSTHGASVTCNSGEATGCISSPEEDTVHTESCRSYVAMDDQDSAKFAMTGLHTCGNLGASLVQLFADMTEVRCLCNVGCCYHLLEEEFMRNPLLKSDEPDPEDNGFPISSFLRSQKCQLGRNARMLAAQPPERLVHKGKLPSDSLFWRALLQVILRDTVGELRADWQVGRIAAKCKDFSQYVSKSFTKLGFSSDQISECSISAYWAQYSTEIKKMRSFFQLKAMLAPCVEAIILLDRLLYLLEQPSVEEAHLVQLFDPVTSPRCYALVAWKHGPQQV